jgi:hypothetical protein
VAGCQSIDELGDIRPVDCVFGGWVRTIRAEEEADFLMNPPWIFFGCLISGILQWRYK